MEVTMFPGVTASAEATTPPTWSHAFTATASQVREARRFLSGILGSFPAADEAVLCLSELASNAVIHSNSRKSGGIFTVTAQVSAGCLRVEVCDEGGPWLWPPPGNEQHGRGLLILDKLARDWGRTGDSETGWTVWFTSTGMPMTGPADHRRQRVAARMELDNPCLGSAENARQRQRWTTVLDGQRLRQLRRQHHLTQAELADQAGIGIATVVRLERQSHAPCRCRTLARLAAALHTEAATLRPAGHDGQA